MWTCVCFGMCGRNRGYTECYCQHWLHSSQRTLGRARPHGVSPGSLRCPPPLQVQEQQSLGSTLRFHLFVLTRLLTYIIAPLKRGIIWKQTKAASWEISAAAAAVRRWCWQMYKPVTSFWTLVCGKINHFTQLIEANMMPKVPHQIFAVFTVIYFS